MKLPAFQFYTGDWMKDPELRSVGYSARGLWIDMLSLMHENVRRGYLQLNGKPVTAEQLARMTGGSTDDVSRLLQELDSSGVYSRTDDGTVFCRRMVRDEQKRAKCSEAGKRGGGNPTFIGASKGDDKGQNKGDPKRFTEDEIEEELKRKKGDFVKLDWDGVTEPPADSTPDDIAPILLSQIGIGRSAATNNAAVEALRLKGSQPGWTVAKAFVHIYQRAQEYKQSAKFKSEFRKSWDKWLINSDYDAPESWNGTGGKVHITESGQKLASGYIPPKKKTEAR